MNSQARNGFMVLAAGMLAVALSAVAARSWDNNHKLVEFWTCNDQNQSQAPALYSERNCVEGEKCVFCLGDTSVGMRVSIIGAGGKYQNPASTACQGDRLIGTCTATATGFPELDAGICDLSLYNVDGTCTGEIKLYTSQPIQP